MITLIFALILSRSLSAQSTLQELKWYLKPDGQELIISIDDLNDEKVIADQSMDWGYSVVPDVKINKDILLAVIDGGVDIEHPELKDFIAFNEKDCFKGNIIPPMTDGDKDNNGYKGDCAGWNFVDATNRAEDLDGHGTHVTGVLHSILKFHEDRIKVLPLKVFAPDEGRRSVRSVAPLSTRLVQAFEYAMSRKVDIIHMSVGWPKSFMTHQLEETIRKALDSGIIIVSAAGNSSQRATIWPCQIEGVICVGALRADGNVARFSNWGSQVDIFAAGEKILSTIPMNMAPMYISRKGHDFKNGTSQAAPIVSAAMAILKASFPHETKEMLFARLMSTASHAINDSGLKGLLHLDRALMQKPSSVILPELKGLHSLVRDSMNKVSAQIRFKNFGISSSYGTKVKIYCEKLQTDREEFILPALEHNKISKINLTGTLLSSDNQVNCLINVNGEKFPVGLKIHNKLKKAAESYVVEQDELLVVNTRSGGRSRFVTLDTLNNETAWPIYFISGAKDLVLYHKNEKLGVLESRKGCEQLRVWQADVNLDSVNDVVVESMCDKKYLQYKFIDLRLQEVAPTVSYTPALTIVNYENFELIPQKNSPPKFRFLNVGLGLPSSSPWDSQEMRKTTHLYELKAVEKESGWVYEVDILENTSKWIADLKLRYLPSYSLLHFIDGKLLIKLGQKTAWVDIATQEASWAGLDDVLLSGSKKQKLLGTEDSILQSFLTPFEYRGFLLNGIKLRFKQDNSFDPFMDIIGTVRNKDGYMTVIRSFQHLYFLQYDFSGHLISTNKNVIDRFDFLTAQDLISSVVNVFHEGEMIQVVDGTKINTSYIDVLKSGLKISFEIPFHCVTQQPVIIGNKVMLPVFCAGSKSEFEMKFIEL